ncbi:hypothetical protein STEG23_032144 [Scotinomys teguina]
MLRGLPGNPTSCLHGGLASSPLLPCPGLLLFLSLSRLPGHRQISKYSNHPSSKKPIITSPSKTHVARSLGSTNKSPHNPFTMHPQLPLHLHTGVPLMQVAAPPVYLRDCRHPPHTTTIPAAAPGNTGSVQRPSSGNTSSSSHIQASNAAVRLAESKVSVPVEASADSSKTDKKLQIQEIAAQEVKLAIKPFYQNKNITKEEYKEIIRKAVDKVCHSKSGEVNSTKVANLVKAYVDKYKYSWKRSQKKALEEPMSTEKNIG